MQHGIFWLVCHPHRISKTYVCTRTTLDIPVVSVSYRDREAAMLDHVLRNEDTSIKLLTDTKNLDKMLACKTKRKQFADDGKLQKCVWVQNSGDFPIHMTGCSDPLDREMTLRCFSNGYLCPEIENWFKNDHKISLQECSG